METFTEVINQSRGGNAKSLSTGAAFGRPAPTPQVAPVYPKRPARPIFPPENTAAASQQYTINNKLGG